MNSLLHYFQYRHLKHLGLFQLLFEAEYVCLQV